MPLISRRSRGRGRQDLEAKVFGNFHHARNVLLLLCGQSGHRLVQTVRGNSVLNWNYIQPQNWANVSFTINAQISPQKCGEFAFGTTREYGMKTKPVR